MVSSGTASSYLYCYDPTRRLCFLQTYSLGSNLLTSSVDTTFSNYDYWRNLQRMRGPVWYLATLPSLDTLATMCILYHIKSQKSYNTCIFRDSLRVDLLFPVMVTIYCFYFRPSTFLASWHLASSDRSSTSFPSLIHYFVYTWTCLVIYRNTTSSHPLKQEQKIERKCQILAGVGH